MPPSKGRHLGPSSQPKLPKAKAGDFSRPTRSSVTETQCFPQKISRPRRFFDTGTLTQNLFATPKPRRSDRESLFSKIIKQTYTYFDYKVGPQMHFFYCRNFTIERRKLDLSFLEVNRIADCGSYSLVK